jgi:UDP-glucuronate 4-epimerase
MHILVTGAAGFIGAATALRLLERGDTVVGLDNLNDYYDVALKEARLARLAPHARFRPVRLDLADRDGMAQLFARERFDCVVHLAAQAGVRYSVSHPYAYADSNLVGFTAVLEGCRHGGVRHLVYASTSSVYGLNDHLPFAEDDGADHPVSFYAATKKANELMAHSYAHLFGLPCTGLRFFTVYGPWGRPDMSPFLFVRAMLAGEPIRLFNHGAMQRDFTYIDDIVEGVVRIVDRPPAAGGTPGSPATSSAPWRVYNIGNNQPVALGEYVGTLAAALGVTPRLDLQPMQPGDVVATAADIAALEQAVGFRPATPLAVGIGRFVEWYRRYYAV